MTDIRSPELGELATALCAAQGEFEAVAKDANNPFFKSKYADLPAVVEAASPILNRHGLSVSQLPGFDEHGDTLTTMLLHTSGQFMGGTLRLRPVKDDPQAQGSAITYGRRYSYMAILGLVADEDDDGNAGSQGRRSAPDRKPAAASGKPKPKSDAKPVVSPDPAGVEGRLVDEVMIGQLSRKRRDAGVDASTLKFKLTELGIEDPTDLPSVMKNLTLEQAMLLGEWYDARIAAAKAATNE